MCCPRMDFISQKSRQSARRKMTFRSCLRLHSSSVVLKRMGPGYVWVTKPGERLSGEGRPEQGSWEEGQVGFLVRLPVCLFSESQGSRFLVTFPWTIPDA